MRSPVISVMAQMCSAALAAAVTTSIAAVPPPSVTTSANETLRLGDPFFPNCASRVYETQLVGDGAPQRWTYWSRVSSVNHCGDGACGIEQGKTWTWTLGFSVTAPIYRWISGGFSVSAGHSMTDTITCQGERGQSVCIWFGKWHEEYSVQNIDYPMDPRCGGMNFGSTVRVTSPRAGTSGDKTWCGRDDWCQEDKVPYWQDFWWEE